MHADWPERLYVPFGHPEQFNAQVLATVQIVPALQAEQVVAAIFLFVLKPAAQGKQLPVSG